MPKDVTRRRFMARTLGMLEGTMAAGELLPLPAEAAQSKQVLRVAVDTEQDPLLSKLSLG